MTVSKFESSKIKIILTDTEVLCCFGSYENLSTMNIKIKNSLNAIVRDIVKENFDFFKGKLTKIRVKLLKDEGCEILIYPITADEADEDREYVFEFSSSENLTQAILYLYKNCMDIEYKSALYNFNDFYRLIIKCKNGKAHFLGLNEFYRFESDDILALARTREYGKQLIPNNAIQVYAKAFFKEI